MAEKITIAGAGLSGLSAAVSLAKAGYDVTVHEKNKRIGERFHGDFQGIENWTKEEDVLDSLRRMNIRTNFTAAPCRKVMLCDSSPKCIAVKGSKPIHYTVRRGHFKGTIDAGIFSQAKKAGAKIVFGKAVDENSADIAATGPKYSDIIAKGITFETDAEDCTYMLIDKKSAPDGYGYMLVSSKKGVIVSCAFSHFRSISKAFEENLGKFRKIKKFGMKNVRDFGGYGNFFLQNSAQKDGRLYVGEAAGFQDFLFGFGIRYALTSGYLAAKSIIENRDYDRLWKKEFGTELKMGISNRFIFEKFTGAEVRIVEAAARLVEPRDILMDIYRPSLLKRMVYPVAKMMMKSRRKCSRGCSCTWCRERSQEI